MEASVSQIESASERESFHDLLQENLDCVIDMLRVMCIECGDAQKVETAVFLNGVAATLQTYRERIHTDFSVE